MPLTLVLDLGISTGVALVTPAAVLTETIQADDLAPYLRGVRLVLTPTTILLERPVMGFRSALSRNLVALYDDARRVFPDLLVVEAWQWKPQQTPLRRYAQATMPEIWKACRSPHERDALLLALWWQKVLRPIPKTR